jgi:mono/diheme cytochrome c family protein
LSTKTRTLLALCLLGIAGVGCRQNMHNQNKVEPYETSAFFEDGQASRQLPAGTVPRGVYGQNIAPYTGLTEPGPPTSLPVQGQPQGQPAQVTLPMIQRGQQRYNVFCSPCHDRVGNGRGMIVLRGFKQPPSFHEARLRSMPAEYFVQVMTEGYGVMPAYAEEVSLQDRWAIAAYMRALQYSQNARLAEIPANRRQALEAEIREGASTNPRSGARGVTRPDAVQDYDRRPDPTEVP